MKTIVHWAAAAALLGGLAATSAEAMPIAPASAVAETGPIIAISGGCGPYRHRGPYGGCRPNGYGFYGGPRPYYRPFYRPGPRCFVRFTFFGPRRFCRW